MLSIGDFSRLGQVTVRTLHVYDKLGLLKPAHVDDTNGYRYYAASQLSRLNRILVLKGMGFSLEQITRLLKENLPADQLRGMFMMKQAEIEQEMKKRKTQLERVAMRLRQIEQEGQLPDYEVILKSIEPLTIVSARQVVPTGEDIPYYRRILFSLVYRFLEPGNDIFCLVSRFLGPGDDFLSQVNHILGHWNDILSNVCHFLGHRHDFIGPGCRFLGSKSYFRLENGVRLFILLVKGSVNLFFTLIIKRQREKGKIRQK